MITLKGSLVYLRALELSDLDFLYELENDESVWEVSNTTTPYSKYVLKQYLENAHRDIYEVKQLRMVICSAKEDRPLGFVDLFDFEPRHRRVGLGIVIFSESDKNKGFASEALKLIEAYVFQHLQLHQLYANISEDNSVSIQLFEKLGYRKAGERIDWISRGSGFKNELMYQRIRNES
jgi:diamine N-acetyltransferase